MKYKNYLKVYRLKRGYSQEAVCKMIGISSVSRLSEWESGKSIPKLGTLLQLAILYGVWADLLYYGYKSDLFDTVDFPKKIDLPTPYDVIRDLHTLAEIAQEAEQAENNSNESTC